MWSEPLTPDAALRDAHTFDTFVRDGNGTVVAGVRVAFNRQARTVLYGSMTITDPNGAPRQTLRALVLLIRETMRAAALLGCRHARAEVAPRMRELARRVTRLQGEELTPIAGELLLIRGDLATMRTWLLDTSDGDGNLATV